ncbi:hypothetical protein [Rhodococcus pyridinivorans]|uniref:hypothetical protein n=1 Tax=Rhodococcus pyridinivorans TaxID=103816 RepID=UPI00110DEF8D|nr:hypothetical protein [Rhodococcus pyridinivorans]
MTFLDYYESTEALVELTYRGFQLTTDMPDIVRILKLGEAKGKEAAESAVPAQKEIDADFATLHAHSLLGLWGAFECFVEDVFKASIVDNSTLLLEEPFKKMKLPVDVFFTTESEFAEIVLTELGRTGSEKKIGVTQFEQILKTVHLDGAVPERVKDAVFLAQQIRHVWAHRGGTADSLFVSRFESRAEIGDKLNIGQDEFWRLARGLLMYSVVIMNRHFKRAGVKLMSHEQAGYEGVLAEVGLS